MKLTCERMIGFIKLLPHMEGAVESEGFLRTLIDRSVNVEILPGYFSEITSIGSRAFQDCPNLALTSLPEGVTSIGDYAFSDCTNLALTSLPEGITSIGNSAFAHCANIALTTLPDGLTSISMWAFLNCTNLTTLTFKGTPTSISDYAFFNCTNLTTINVPWSEGEVANAPWGATNATINYNYTGE